MFRIHRRIDNASIVFWFVNLTSIDFTFFDDSIEHTLVLLQDDNAGCQIIVVINVAIFNLKWTRFKKLNFVLISQPQVLLFVDFSQKRQKYRKMPLMILISKSESLIFFPRQIKLRCFVLILQTLLRNFTKKGQTWIFPSNQEIKLAEEFSREILEVKFYLTLKTEISLLFSLTVSQFETWIFLAKMVKNIWKMPPKNFY